LVFNLSRREKDPSGTASYVGLGHLDGRIEPQDEGATGVPTFNPRAKTVPLHLQEVARAAGQTQLAPEIWRESRILALTHLESYLIRMTDRRNSVELGSGGVYKYDTVALSNFHSSRALCELLAFAVVRGNIDNTTSESQTYLCLREI
jgi:hypothetical protein